MLLNIKPHCSIRAKRDISFLLPPSALLSLLQCSAVIQNLVNCLHEVIRARVTRFIRVISHRPGEYNSTETHGRLNHSTTVIPRSVRNKTLDSFTHRVSNTYKAYRVCQSPNRMDLRTETPHHRNNYTGYN